MPRICIVPIVGGIGGMASFRGKFEAGLQRRGILVTHNPEEECDAVLVIGGTRKLLPLWRARRRGTRIVQRLDGINWVHKRRKTGMRHYLRAEYGNMLLSLIRGRVATRIVYQSEFTREWWEDWYGPTRVACSVVHNGVDLSVYTPEGKANLPAQSRRLLVVEGSLGGGYDMGLDNAVELAGQLKRAHGLPVEMMVVGKITESHRRAAQSRSGVRMEWAGTVSHDRIPEVDRSAHVLFSADLNAACPNSVIEALACGLPVVAFDTGALKELVVGDAGRIVPYGGDPWKFEKPDIPALATATAEVLGDQARFSSAARAHAEKTLGIDRMVDGYLNALLEA